MGAFASRQHAGVEEVDVTSNHAYKYPPRSGNYFGSHFIMGGERFDTPQPESYLFGENSDLNFLGSRPTPFPYPPPQPNEPTKTLKSLVNIRKESLRFVRAPIDYCKPVPEKNDRDVEAGKCSTFNIEFTFDCDVRCAITIYYFCTEEFAPNGVMYLPRDSTMTSETFHYKRGANQQFCQMTHVFDPSKYSEDELLYDVDREVIPIAIHCVAEEGPEELRQSHTTIATAEKITDGTYVLKALKQKLFVDGLCYLLQEIYGIENKNNDKQSGDDETEDNGSECVICMCDVRDTLILPCRHLCLCNSCADSLRYQANNCPICRAPFRALLQIRALQKCANPNLPSINPPDGSCDNIPPGYEAVSLIEALNGPCLPSNRQPPSAMPDLVETPDSEHAIQAAQILNRGVDRTPPMKNKNMDPSAPEYGILMTRGSGGVIEEENKETPKCPLLVTDQKDGVTKTSNNNNSPRITNSKLHSHRATNNIKDTIVKHVNEKIAVEKEETLLDEDSETEKLSPLLQNSPRGGGGDAVTQPNKQRITMIANNLALNMEDVVEPIDDIVDNEHEEESSGGARTSNVEKTKNYRNSGEERGDESDYYTPEEPPAVAPSSTMGTDDMGPLYTENSNTAASTGTAPSSSVESTPQRVPSSSGAGGEGGNPPGTPASLSSSSGRSSGGGGDTSSTYSSSSSGSSSGSSTRHLLAVVTNGGGGGIVGERGAVHI